MALIDKLKSDYVIGDSRVYMTGHSNGASMTITFAFKYTEVLAAIAPASEPWMTGDRTYDIDPYTVSQPTAPIRYTFGAERRNPARPPERTSYRKSVGWTGIASARLPGL